MPFALSTRDWPAAPAQDTSTDTKTQAAAGVQVLPPLVWLNIVSELDSFTRRQLKLVNRLTCSVVKAAMAQQLSLAASDLKETVLLEEGLAASCLCITAPQRPIALSGMNQRRRCEQRLAIFFDNVAAPNLRALDISTALSHISCATLQLLVESLPHLQQLSLPPVATCGGTEADALSTLFDTLQQLPGLCACDLDCSLFSQQRNTTANHLQEGLVQQQDTLYDVGAFFQQQQKTQQQVAQQQVAWTPQAAAGAAAAAALSEEPSHQQHEEDPQQHTATLHWQPPERQQAGAATTTPQAPWHPSSTATTDDAQIADHLAELEVCDNSVCRSGPPSSSAIATSSAQHSSYGSSRSSVSTSGAASSADGCGCACARSAPSVQPWLGLCDLKHVQHLQLQHLQPSCVCDAVCAVAKMPCLVSLSITELSQAAASLALLPLESTGTTPPQPTGDAAAAAGQHEDAMKSPWLLEHLRDLPHMTRLEIGLDTACSSVRTSSNGSPSAGLIIPAHTGSAAVQAAGVVAGPECSWSALHQLQELILHGICLDSTLLAATFNCAQLNSLQVGALDLHQDVRALVGLGCSPAAASNLRVLQVDQHFNMGPNMMAVLAPQLQSLKLVHGGNCSPDLACLEHHEHLSRLDVAAPLGSRWCLHALQLGCLVHLGALKELRLAETVDDDYCATTSAGGAGGSSSSNISSRGGSFSRSKTAGYKPGPPCNKASSHWLPACTGSLSQVTSLELCGPVPDLALGQVPKHFPALKRLTVDSSYFASDGGLQRLNCAPHLQLLVLRNCRHITDYGLEVLMMAGGIRVVAVQGCAGIDERACHRIRKACRFSGCQLLWYGPDARASGGSSPQRPPSSARHSHSYGSGRSSLRGDSSSSDCSPTNGCSRVGSAFLQRCWRQECDTAGAHQACHVGPTAALIAAATAVWQDSCSQEAAAAGGAGSAVSRPAGSSACSRSRTNSSGCVPVSGVHGAARSSPWSKNSWGGGHTLAH